MAGLTDRTAATQTIDECPIWAVFVRQVDGYLADSTLHPKSASSPKLKPFTLPTAAWDEIWLSKSKHEAIAIRWQCLTMHGS